MIIRLLTQNDIAEHDKITSQAFSYSCDVQDPQSRLPCEKVLGAFDDDNKTLFADLEIHDRACHYDGGVLRCAAVGGVAAKPEHRGKGAVKALFGHLFAQTDYDISILYPFSEAYYRKLGYERTGCSVCAAVPFSELSGIERNQDAALYEGNGTQQLLELYNRCARAYNLSLIRENAEAYSDKPYLSMKYTYIHGNGSYATLSVDREKSTVFVHEIFFDSCASMRGILGFLRNYESNQKYVCFEKIPADSPLLNCIRDLKNCEISVHNTGSARIMNPERVLRAHRYPAAGGAFTVQIGDDIFTVAYADGAAQVVRDGAREPDAVMDIGTASGLLLRGFTDAAYVPGIEIRNPGSDFFTAFPPKTAFFTDNL